MLQTVFQHSLVIDRIDSIIIVFVQSPPVLYILRLFYSEVDPLYIDLCALYVVYNVLENHK